MANRTTSGEVVTNLGLDYDGKRKPGVANDVASANSVVTRVLADWYADGGAAVDATTARLMEMWAACWFYTRRDSLYSARTTLGASGSFTRPDDAYLQGAKAVDPTGTLEAELLGQVARGGWLGKADEDAVAYDDRNGINIG